MACRFVSNVWCSFGVGTNVDVFMSDGDGKAEKMDCDSIEEEWNVFLESF